MKNWKCGTCKVPRPFVTPKSQKICESCYFTQFWHNKYKHVVKNKNLLQLSNVKNNRT